MGEVLLTGAKMTQRQPHHQKLALAHESCRQLHRPEGVSSRELSLSESDSQQSLLLIYAWEEPSASAQFGVLPEPVSPPFRMGILS